jgi:hypothetical protein
MSRRKVEGFLLKRNMSECDKMVHKPKELIFDL